MQGPNVKHLYIAFICQLVTVVIVFYNYYLCSRSFILPKQITQTTYRKEPVGYIITVPGEDQRVEIVMSTFKQYAGIDLRRFNGIRPSDYLMSKYSTLSRGEQSLRATMAKFFNMMIREGHQEVFVFEDDAIPHRNFTYLFKELSLRCREADVLLLGATMWHGKHIDWPSGSCFNADRRTFGAFALLVKRNSFSHILKWLLSGTQAPYDHVYGYLQQKNLTVRVAFAPFLVIPDITHPSLVNNNRSNIQFNINVRSERHIWHIEDYPMYPIPVPTSTSTRQRP